MKAEEKSSLSVEWKKMHADTRPHLIGFSGWPKPESMKSNPQKRAKAKEKAKDTCEQKKRAIELVEVTEGEGSEDEASRPVA